MFIDRWNLEGKTIKDLDDETIKEISDWLKEVDKVLTRIRINCEKNIEEGI